MIKLHEYQRKLIKNELSGEICLLKTDGKRVYGRVETIEFDHDAPDGDGYMRINDRFILSSMTAGIIECPIGTPV